MSSFVVKENWGMTPQQPQNFNHRHDRNNGHQTKQSHGSNHFSHSELLAVVVRQQNGVSYLNTGVTPRFVHHEPPERELIAAKIKPVDQPRFLLAVNRGEHAAFHFVRFEDLWHIEGDEAAFVSLTCDFTPEENEIYENLICSREMRQRIKEDILERRRKYLRRN